MSDNYCLNLIDTLLGIFENMGAVRVMVKRVDIYYSILQYIEQKVDKLRKIEKFQSKMLISHVTWFNLQGKQDIAHIAWFYTVMFHFNKYLSKNAQSKRKPLKCD